MYVMTGKQSRPLLCILISNTSMPRVFIPPSLKFLAASASFVDIEARSVREIIDRLDETFPGISERLREGEALKSGLAVSIDGKVATLGLYQRVDHAREVHFVLAIGGG